MRKIYVYTKIFHIEKMERKIDNEDTYRIFLNNEPTKYYITYSGRIFNKNKELCKSKKNITDYYKYTNIKGKDIYLHQLIFICFAKHFQDEKYKNFIENNVKYVTIDHIDNNKNNNSYDNLQAISNQENIKKNPPKKRNVDFSFKTIREFKEYCKEHKNIKHIKYKQKIKNVTCNFNNIYVDISTRKLYLLYRRKTQIKLYIPKNRWDGRINIYDTTHKQRRINYTKVYENILNHIDKEENNK